MQMLNPRFQKYFLVLSPTKYLSQYINQLNYSKGDLGHFHNCSLVHLVLTKGKRIAF